jgi:CelD/BcsL family acetyltransferase involved in cellulose biosynthesis
VSGPAENGAGLEAAWITDSNVLMAMRGEWQSLVEQTGADLFLGPDWFELWWQHFGDQRKLAALVVRQQGRLVGLLPFCIDRLGLGPIAVRVARLAGTDPHCIVFRLPVEPALGDQILLMAVRHLLGPVGCHAVSLTPVSDRAEFLPWITDIDEDQPDLVLTMQPDGSHVMFDLPATFDAYLAELSRNRRGQIRSDLRALEGQFAMQSSANVPDAGGFAAFVAFHNTQWQAIGKGGHFADWPGSAEFYSSLSSRSKPGWGVRIDSATGRLPDGSAIDLAAVFSLVAGDTCHARLPARTLNEQAARLSIGKTALVLMIRGMIASGIRRIEAGRGEYDYKLSLGGKDVPVHRLLISRRDFHGRIRLLLGAAGLIDVLHYKIWFKRIVPPLRRATGLGPRRLWRLWIRTRV